MAVLVTGAAGFVALNVVEHLLRAGREVVGLDRIALPARATRVFAGLPGRLTMIGGSVLSDADLSRALTIAPVDRVIHCAVITAGSAREKAAPETILPRIAETQGLGFAAARLGSVYGPWEYATGVRDTLSPMLQVMDCARRGEAAVLSPPWRGDYIYARDVADGLVRLADAEALSHTIYNVGSGRSESAETWCEALAPLVPGFRWHRAVAGETPNVESHTGFDRGAMDIARVAGDTGFAPRFDFAQAAADWLAWAAG